MSKWGWFSANDDGKVVAKTEVRDDGSVHRYDYTKEDDISKGHGHKTYDNMDKYINDNETWSRDKSEKTSANRRWYGNGFDISLSEVDELILLRDTLIQSLDDRTNQKIYKLTFKKIKNWK